MSDRPAANLSRPSFTLRSILFWAHLIGALTAGSLILLMSVTGVLLTYERQLIAWSDRGYRSTVAPGASRLPVGTLLADLAQTHPEITPTAVTIASTPDAPVTIAAGPRTLYVDAYTAAWLGEGTPTVRRFMTGARAWHRWLAIEGEGRATARLFTGWANAIFLFIVVSGFYLWFPRKWSWQHVRPVVWFNGRLRGKARDFNWHNTIGAWSVVPLFIIVLSALPMSFPWANAALYRAVGDTAPRPGGGNAGPARGGGRERGAAAEPLSADTINGLWSRAMAQETRWQTITFRPPAGARAPLAFAIDRGNGGQPQLRSTLTLDRAGKLLAYQTFADQSAGARLRGISRFAHTGEVLGVPGQTIAGLSTAGAAVLVCTGFALACRRLAASFKRRAQRSVRNPAESAA